MRLRGDCGGARSVCVSLSAFSLVSVLVGSGVPAHDALRLMVDTHEGRRPMAMAGEDHRAALATRSRRMPTPYCYLRCGDLRSPGVTERRNGPLGLRNDDDDDYRYY